MLKVKICGITNVDDARAAIDAGADWLGFVFYAPSPRYVSPESARRILEEIRDWRLEIGTVGVFVNDSLKRVGAVMRQVGLDLAQLHGQEPAAVVTQLAPRAYKALSPRDPDHARALIEEYRASVNASVPAFIVDAPPQALPGGNGVRADWSLAARIARDFPILLAGGLNVENVADAIEAVQPWGVDVSSGVERMPGLKDHVKVREFVRRAKDMKG